MDQELSPGESSQVEAHLGHCSDCTGLQQRFEAQASQLAVLPPDKARSADPRFWDRMDATLTDELDQFETVYGRPGEPESWKRRRVSISMAAVLVYAAALLLAVWWGWSHSEPADTASETAESPTTETPSPVVGEMVELGRPFPTGANLVPRLDPSKLQPQPRVTVPPELIQPAAYMPHRGNF